MFNTLKSFCTMRTVGLACVLIGGAGMTLGGLLPWYVCIGIVVGNCWTVWQLTK